jgi:hypothetical protein
MESLPDNVVEDSIADFVVVFFSSDFEDSDLDFSSVEAVPAADRFAGVEVSV